MSLPVAPLDADSEAPGLYVHVPFCRGKCRYCGFYSRPTTGRDLHRVISALLTEVEKYRHVRTVRTLYVGGGSPTSLPLELLAHLVESVASIWPDVEEFTVECNPGQVTAEVLSALRRCGVNRLSFGVQSLHPTELELLGRRHTIEDAQQSIRLAQELGFGNIGIDLIFAIPGSTLESWEQCLRLAVRLGVQHISAYSLSFEPGTDLDHARKLGQIEPVDEKTDRAMYELAIDCLVSAGFEQYEISNFARDGFACRHNQGYWQNRPYIGIGPSASSYWQGERTTNVADLDAYVLKMEAGLAATEERQRPDRNDRICETAVLNLRTRQGVDLVDFRRRTGADFQQVFGAPVHRYEQQGLIETTAGRVRLARKALAIADAVLCDFSAL